MTTILIVAALVLIVAIEIAWQSHRQRYPVSGQQPRDIENMTAAARGSCVVPIAVAIGVILLVLYALAGG